MSREQAAEHMAKALADLATARRVGPGPAGTHFAALAHGHALIGIFADLAVEVRPQTSEILTRAGSVLISSDCRDGAHRACAGTGWDDAANLAVECPCECHQ